MTARNVATDRDPTELRNHAKTALLRRQTPGRIGISEESTSVALGDASSVPGAHPCGLSVRALNVLKLFAAEITGECPPRENWTPSSALLQELTVKRLLAARNCGPITVREILRWAESRGISIPPQFHAGKSLTETWRDLNVKFMAGELTKAEVTEALEKSARRRSSKIPVSVQKILLKILKAASQQARV
jgi:hypothetical protein